MSKIFKCPVHGYISISNDYCEHFIDTPIFQRLRHIEQTGMRSLYPSAHHDRFIHSLGVLHLGQIASSCFLKNASAMFKEQGIHKDTVAKSVNSFLIACLLHDCCHAPFSHTFENEYNSNNRLDNAIKEIITDARFLKDYDSPTCDPASHEKASVIVVIKHFKEDIDQCGGDPILVARAILGCMYSSPNDEERLENALISLLNGKAIDVDKLDYIIRDTWASGINNVSIDVERLLSSLTYRNDKDGKSRLSFNKQALSVLQSVVEGRNYLYRWVHGHHKVVYYQVLLSRALNKAAKLFAKDDPEAFLEQLFSVDSILEPQVIDGMTIYLPTDGDIYYFLKRYIMDDEDIMKVFSRNHHKVLWKSYIEYERIFQSIPGKDERDVIRGNASDVMCNYCDLEQFIIKDVEPKILIDLDSIYVVFGEESVPYTKLFNKNDVSGRGISKFYYIYGPAEILSRKDEIIRQLKDQC